MIIDTEVIAANVLEWARDAHPDKYQQTVEVSPTPRAFRAYLLRLAELRWAEDHAWRAVAPLRLLEETRIVGHFRLPDGREIEARGRRSIDPAKGEWRVWGWGEIADHIDAGRDLAQVLAMKEALDLALLEGQPTPVVEWAPPPVPPKPARRTRRTKGRQSNIDFNDQRRDES